MKRFCKPMQEQYQGPVFSAANLHVESQIRGHGNLLESAHRVDFVMSNAVSAIAKFGLHPVGKSGCGTAWAVAMYERSRRYR
jgi:hypothetical protein